MGNTYPITFESSRIVDSQQISTGPAHLQALERALGELIDVGGNGVAFGTEIEKAPFAVNSYGWLLGSSAHAQVPGIGGTPKTEQGLRLLDQGNNSQALLTVNNGYLEVYDDGHATPDWDTTPSWGTYKNRMDLSSGLWESDSVGTGCQLRTTDDSIATGSWEDIVWDTTDFDSDTIFDGTSTITIPATGVYLLTGWVEENTAGLVPEKQYSARWVSSEYGNMHFGYDKPYQYTIKPFVLSCSDIFLCTAAATFKLQIFQDSGSARVWDARLGLWKLGVTA